MNRRSRKPGIAGGSHYAGSTLADLQEDLNAWREDAQEAIARFEKLHNELEATKDWLDDVGAIKHYIEVFLERFRLYLRELECISDGIAVKVLEGHAGMTEALWREVDQWRINANEYMHEHIGRSLKDKRLKKIVDSIYFETLFLCDGRTDLLDFGPRLRCFVGMQAAGSKKTSRDAYRTRVLEIVRRAFQDDRGNYRQVLAALDEHEETLQDHWFRDTKEDFSKHGKEGKAGNIAEIETWSDIANNQKARARFQTWLLDQKRELGFK